MGRSGTKLGDPARTAGNRNHQRSVAIADDIEQRLARRVATQLLARDPPHGPLTRQSCRPAQCGLMITPGSVQNGPTAELGDSAPGWQ